MLPVRSALIAENSAPKVPIVRSRLLAFGEFACFLCVGGQDSSKEESFHWTRPSTRVGRAIGVERAQKSAFDYPAILNLLLLAPM